MQVTDVRVRRVEKEGKMKAIVSITLDNAGSTELKSALWVMLPLK